MMTHHKHEITSDLDGVRRQWCFGDLEMFGFDVAEIDPPWNFDLYSAKGQKKSPQAQYQTMAVDEISALPVGDLLAPGGLAVVWCTWPLVAAGIHVTTIKGWGLEPVTGGGWAKRTKSGKLRWGTGYVARSMHEPYIIARLPSSKWNGASFPNLIETLEAVSVDGLAREHSRKPDEFYSLVEAAWPEARRVSLFSRQSRAGWKTWGNEARKFDADDDEFNSKCGLHCGSEP